MLEFYSEEDRKIARCGHGSLSFAYQSKLDEKGRFSEEGVEFHQNRISIFHSAVEFLNRIGLTVVFAVVQMINSFYCTCSKMVSFL